MTSRPTFASMIEVDGGPLGIEFRCGRRALMPPAALGAYTSNMPAIQSLRFVWRECSSEQCGA